MRSRDDGAGRPSLAQSREGSGAQFAVERAAAGRSRFSSARRPSDSPPGGVALRGCSARAWRPPGRPAPVARRGRGSADVAPPAQGGGPSVAPRLAIWAPPGIGANDRRVGEPLRRTSAAIGPGGEARTRVRHLIGASNPAESTPQRQQSDPVRNRVGLLGALAPGDTISPQWAECLSAATTSLTPRRRRSQRWCHVALRRAGDDPAPAALYLCREPASSAGSAMIDTPAAREVRGRG